VFLGFIKPIRRKWSMKMHEVVLITILGFTASFIRIAFATESSPVNYGDCAYMEFEDVDPAELTLQERIDLLNADLFTSLDKSEKCMQKAAVSAADKVGAAGAGSVKNTGNDSLDATDVGQGADGQSQRQTRSTSSSSPSSPSSSINTDKKRGLNTGGSSAVCDAVNQGLVSATTDSEKEHFKGLKKQYGCK
jgi:hypothetical protein